MKQQVIDSVHKIKVEVYRMEHEAISACQVLEQCLQGFEIAGALTIANLTKKFVK